MAENTKLIDVLNDQPTEVDGLDFQAYVETLAEIITSPGTGTPLTIGVFGGWGAGKTSLMQMVLKELPDTQLAVWFDAWKYDGETVLWRALLLKVLDTLLGAVPAKDETQADMQKLEDLQTALYRDVDREEIGQLQIDWGKLAQGVGQGALQVGLSFLPGVGTLAKLVEALQAGAGKDAPQAFIKAFERERSKIHIQQVQFLDQFQTRFQELVAKYIQAQGKRLVVFIDDLDRCLPEKAVEVLEAIKLFLHAPGCIFVLGLDEEVIARGIELKYREMGLAAGDEGRQMINGLRYLEKIVQLPFQIPPVERENMLDFVSGLVGEWPHADCPKVFAAGLGDNPRQIKRTVNVFLMLWRLANKRPELVDKINPVRLAKVVSIQQTYPELYKNVLKNNPRQLAELEKYYRAESWQALQTPEEGGELEKINPPPILKPYIGRGAVREVLLLHAEKATDFNFRALNPDEIRQYITLARRTEVTQASVEESLPEYYLPELVDIPAGEFLMGSSPEYDPSMRANEQPQHLVSLPAYRIGRYPVTNLEYQAFVWDNSRQPPQGWHGENYPQDKEDHPVVNVTWYDAIAYCKWLSIKSGQHCRLPSEAEWEKAARGVDGRIYPWGNVFDPKRCNTGESRPGGTTPVGRYSPEGDSPYGCADIAGNVWEWTASFEESYPYVTDGSREETVLGNLRVLRGGSWDYVQNSARCASRDGSGPDSRYGNLGFRVVVSPD